jgi:hypothetical protein
MITKTEQTMDMAAKAKRLVGSLPRISKKLDSRFSNTIPFEAKGVISD